MFRVILCPHCGEKFQVDDEETTRMVLCPGCGNDLFVCKKALPPLKKEQNLDLVPEEPDPTGLASLGRHYAREISINLKEAGDPREFGKKTIQETLKEWKVFLPDVLSAYQPSGALPVAGLFGLLLGAFFGTLAGILALIILAGLIFLVGAFLGLILLALAFWAGILGIALLLLVILLAVVVPFASAGGAAGFITTFFGRWGKNRNTKVAVILSLLSSSFAVLGFWEIFQFWGEEPLNQWWLQQGIAFNCDIVCQIITILGLLIAIGMACFVANEAVCSAKFCETCEHFMEEEKLKVLTLGGLRAMAKALAEKKSAIAASLLFAPTGGDGEIKLFVCPHCFRGYAELKINFRGHWREGEKAGTIEESWLVASVELARDEVEKFRTCQKVRLE